MSRVTTFVIGCFLFSLAEPVAAQQTPSAKAPPSMPEIHSLNIIHAPAAVIVALDQRLPQTKLMPAKIIKDLCHYKYRVTTNSPECQTFVDQSLGYFYSYVWMEAARSAETAIRHDPECAYAWFALHRALEKWGRGDANKALEKAKELMPKAGQREQLIIQAKLQEKGMWPGVGPEDRKKKAAATLDELLTLYDDDEEGWFARAQINGGNEGVVYYKALLKVDPLHPGANHELVHFYEGYKRPALGWPFAEAYIASSPGIPHAFHMQAHLGTRIGKWGKTTDWSARAIELQKAYHQEMNVKTSEDWQYDHHLETLTRSLIHDGRIAEAKAIHDEIDKNNARRGDWALHWFRMYRTGYEWDELKKFIAETRKYDKPTASYYAACVALDQGNVQSATAEVDVLRQELQKKKNDRRLEQRLWEVQGRLMCQQGSGDEGIKLMQRAVDKTKDNYTDHAWGHGAYYMEQWGIGALEAGNAAMAEEAFLEALAHDAGSARAALGMQALCDRLGRIEEAARFAQVAERCWAKADRKVFELLRDDMRKKAEHVAHDATTTGR
jgi:tetratricopeptide (TPR) repeat protein